MLLLERICNWTLGIVWVRVMEWPLASVPSTFFELAEALRVSWLVLKMSCNVWLSYSIAIILTSGSGSCMFMSNGQFQCLSKIDSVIVPCYCITWTVLCNSLLISLCTIQFENAVALWGCLTRYGLVPDFEGYNLLTICHQTLGIFL